MSKDENVEDWFDRVMAESGLDEPIVPDNIPRDEIVFTEEDMRALLGLDVVEDTGFVYYDERSGAIRGVSHGLDQEMVSRFGALEVSADIATSFMSGVSDLSAWMVGYQGEPTPKLLPTTIEYITVHPASTSYTVVTEASPAPVQMIVVVPQNEPIGAVVLVPRPGLRAEAGFEEPFDIMLTRRGSPDEIVARFVIDPKELFTKGELPLDLGGIINHEVDILTKPLSSIQYVLQPFQEASRPLPMPLGRFVDLLPFERTERLSERPAGLAVDIYEDRMVVHLHGGGGRSYDRAITAVMIAVCREANPEALLFCARVPLDELRAGPVSVSFADTPIDDAFEVFSQRFFVHNYFRDMRKSTADPLVAPRGLDMKLASEVERGLPAMLVSVDPKGSMVIGLVEDGGRPYAHELEEMRVTFTHPDSVELILWSTSVRLEDIRNGVCRVDVPPAVVNQKFAIYTQHVYENTFWRFADNTSSRPDRIGDSHWMERRERNSEVPPPCLAVWVERGRNLLRVQALNGGGARDLEAEEMRIAICSTRDPESMICIFKAPVKRLEQGDMLGFPLPVEWHPELVNGYFEVLVQSVYTSAYIFE
jgi:hypothetical protein